MELFNGCDLLKIPPFLETDVYNKIIISITSEILTHKNISYAIKGRDDIIRFRGSRIDHYDYVCYWCDFYNSGRTLLDLITKEHIAIRDAGMIVYYIIIDSVEDLEKFIVNWKLTDTELGKELINYWQKNHNMIIQQETQP